MADLAKLVVSLEAQTAKYQKGLDQANKKLSRFEKAQKRSVANIQRGFKNLAAVVGSSFFVRAVRQQLTLAGNLERVSETVGFTTDAIQKYRFAAEQLNLSQQTIDLGLQRFSRRLAEAAQGQGELTKVVEKYGVAIRDSQGQLRSSNDVLRDFANVVANTKDEQEQLRIAFKLFDSEGAGLVRLLRQGEQGLDAFGARAEELGIVLSSDVIARSAEADRVLNEVGQTLRGQLTRAVADNADAFILLGNAIGRIAEAAGVAIGGLSKLKNALDASLGGVGATLEDDLERLEKKLQRLQGGTDIFNPFFGNDEKIAKEIQTTIALIDQTKAAIEQLNRTPAEVTVTANIDPVLRQSPADAFRLVNDASAKLDKAIQKYDSNLASFAGRFKTAEEQAANLRAEIKRFENDLTSGQLANANAAVFDILTSGLEELDISDVLEKADQRMKDLKDSTKDVEKEALKLDFAFESAFESAIIEGEKFSQVLKGLIDDILKLLIRNSITNPLAGFFGGLFGGGLATGGPVSAGTTYLVGERGPELFAPTTSGKIIPNGGIGGGNVSFVINNTVNGANDPSSTVKLLEENSRLTESRIFDRLRREGVG